MNLGLTEGVYYYYEITPHVRGQSLRRRDRARDGAGTERGIQSTVTERLQKRQPSAQVVKVR